VTAADPPLARGLGFRDAAAVNVTQVVGAGVFATIPLILGVLPAAYALLAWLVAGVLILADGMVWGELGGAMSSGSGSAGRGGITVPVRDAGRRWRPAPRLLVERQTGGPGDRAR
jgi:amino acid transporter